MRQAPFAFFKLAALVFSSSLLATGAATGPADVTLEGTANYIAGSDLESGSFTLLVKGNHESKLTLNLSGGTRQEIRGVAPVSSPASSGATAATSSSPGVWVGADGVKHAMALHNCWVDASVLFPALSLQWASSDPQVTLVDAGPTLRDGATVDHLRLTRTLPGLSPAMTAEIQSLSAVDIYLDPATHLPVALEFNTHPDNTLTINIPVEIRFSDYRRVNGVQVPFHIQKFLQRTLTLDLAVTSATINAGLRDSDFGL